MKILYMEQKERPTPIDFKSTEGQPGSCSRSAKAAAYTRTLLQTVRCMMPKLHSTRLAAGSAESWAKAWQPATQGLARSALLRTDGKLVPLVTDKLRWYMELLRIDKSASKLTAAYVPS